ncbi:MAG: hypothetical protein D6812_02360 [Deltaproteobacteria bacterium]|nr:MAG: hypothetical protein D6812_02360 [Deltaproteobacteria bacterium]
MIVAKAPAKLIITGEHAVVHGRSAIVTAIDRFASTTLTPMEGGTIRIELPGLGETEDFTRERLASLRRTLTERYRAFREGRIGVEKILDRPIDRFAYGVALFLEGYAPDTDRGFLLRIDTDFPGGSGLGSSAATVASMIVALSHAFGHPLPIEARDRLVFETEKLCHGTPSGVDPYIVVHGGCVVYHRGGCKPLPPPTIPFRLIHTGRPTVTTGVTVARVTEAFPPVDPIWNEFEAVAVAMERLFLSERPQEAEMIDLVRRNHRLLVQIGVVPQRVRALIEAIEAEGGAAKICGAGAVEGEQAGIVLTITDHPLEDYCEGTPFSPLIVHGEPEGARLAESNGTPRTS